MVLRFKGFFFGTIFLRGLLHFLNAFTGSIFQTRQYRTILIDFTPSPVALFLSTNTAVAELIFKIYLFIPTKIKNS